MLPDHRLRIAGKDGVNAVVVGLLPDGRLDTGFDGDGIATLPPGEAFALAADAAGNLAVAGETTAGDAFLVPVAAGGTVGAFANLGAGRGVDVAWPAGDPVVLRQAGADSIVDGGAGFTDVTLAGVQAGGLLAHAGRLWVAGTVVTDGNSDAYLARVGAAGGGAESRRFDMIGERYKEAPQVVDTVGSDLAVLPGDPDSIVVVGSASTDVVDRWAAAAFNGLDGPVTALPSTDYVFDLGFTPSGRAASVAGRRDGVAVAAGDLVDATADIGMARLLVDADKRCDLTLAVVSPIELVMRGARSSMVTLRATNTGSRACGGTVSAPGPYVLAAGPLATGRLLPGQSFTGTVEVSYPARPLPPHDLLVLTLVTSPVDSQPGDNVARLPVTFAYCDLRLQLRRGPRVVGTEGGRVHTFSVRNLGTTTCRGVRLRMGGRARQLGLKRPYTVPAGQSVIHQAIIGVKKRTRVGRRAALRFAVVGRADVRLDNNVAGAVEMVVRPGDTKARTPSATEFRGTAKRGRARGVRKRSLRLERVQIAVLRRGKGCRWLSSAAGDLRVVDTGPKGACNQPVWITADGRSKWHLELRKALPPGRYVLLTRAVLKNGVAEAALSRRDRSRIRFRVR